MSKTGRKTIRQNATRRWGLLEEKLTGKTEKFRRNTAYIQAILNATKVSKAHNEALEVQEVAEDHWRLETTGNAKKNRQKTLTQAEKGEKNVTKIREPVKNFVKTQQNPSNRGRKTSPGGPRSC